MPKKIAPSKTNVYIKAKREILEHLKENSFLTVSYSRWYIGITNDVKRRKPEHETKNQKNCKYWRSWNIETMNIARSLEFNLHRKGFAKTNKKGNIIEQSTFIYVYKIYPTLFDMF